MPGQRSRGPVTIAVVVALAIGVGADVERRSQFQLAALPASARSPADNPATPERVSLGRLLFFDPILSGNRDVACATCHQPALGYTDGRDLPIGSDGVGHGSARHLSLGSSVPLGTRNTPTLLNVAFAGLGGSGEYDPASAPMFWDMRVQSLETQALEPLVTLEEMRGPRFTTTAILPEILGRLQRIDEYKTRFTNAFGPDRPISLANVARAIAAFERTLVTANAPFDRYMRGDAAAMSSNQITGMRHFQGAGCLACHHGPMLSDYKVHVLGVPDNAGRAFTDAGVQSSYGFRTASLRNLAYSAPYFHSGVFDTLNEVLAFYNSRGAGLTNPLVRLDQLDPLLLQVSVGGSRLEVLDFLAALNDPAFDRTVPDRVPSGLRPGGNLD